MTKQKPSTDLDRIFSRLRRDCGLLVTKLGGEAEEAIKDIKKKSAEVFDKGLDDFSTMMNTTAKEVSDFNKKRKAKTPPTPPAPDQPQK